MTTDAVKAELVNYKAVESTAELYGIGSMLINESLDRTKQLDTKATALMGYSGVILALLVSNFVNTIGKMPAVQQWSLVGAGVCVITASAIALSVLSMKEFEWFSDLDWFEPSLLEKPETLKRFHVLVMHRLTQQHGFVNARKARLLGRAYTMVVSCCGLLTLALSMPQISRLYGLVFP
jgi:hypothetical protein